ncbi:MAG: hypothetical protein A2096_07845 [Spirochaetes bacterium GWF1_41_5]|nr:MAG: hypothetical protein A2096_07845 [Spirochaetes bacterium GWF1_41_5]HBE04548.1 hypothetical protein [Spirochaetia bacterium]
MNKRFANFKIGTFLILLTGIFGSWNHAEDIGSKVYILGNELQADYIVSSWGAGLLENDADNSPYLTGQPDPAGKMAGMALKLRDGKNGIQLGSGKWYMHYEINYDYTDSSGQVGELTVPLMANVFTVVNLSEKPLGKERKISALDKDIKSWEARTYTIEADGPFTVTSVSFQYIGPNPPEGMKVRKIFFSQQEQQSLNQNSSIKNTTNLSPVVTPAEKAGLIDLPAPEKEKWQQIFMRTDEQRAKGLRGGDVSQNGTYIAICESDPSAIALASDLGSIYISYDGAKNWNMRHKGINANGTQGVAFDPKNKHILFCLGTKSSEGARQKAGDLRNKPFLEEYYSPLVDGIYYTENDGLEWKLVFKCSAARNKAQHNYFAFDPRSFDGKRCLTIYAGTHTHGLIKSTDGGNTWKTIGLENLKIETVILHPLNNKIIFIAAYEGFYKSIDSGSSFKKCNDLPNEILWGLDLSKSKPDKIFCVFGKAGVYRSKDGGDSFEKLAGAPEQDYRRIACSPVDDKIVYLDGNYFENKPYHSWDGGETWQPFESADGAVQEPGQLAWSADGLAAHPTERLMAFANRPVHKTIDGGKTWKYCSDGISGMRLQVRTSAAFSKNPDIIALTFTDLGPFITKNNCNTFIRNNNLERFEGGLSGSAMAWEPVKGSKKIFITIGSWSKQMLRISTDEGQTWSDVQGAPKGLWYYLAFHQQNHQVLYAQVRVDGVHKGYKSSDGGKIWNELEYVVMAAASKNSDIIFGTDAGLKAIYKSPDAGKSWQKIHDIVYQAAVMDCDSKGEKLYIVTGYSVHVFNGSVWFSPGTQEGVMPDIFSETRFGCIAVDQGKPEIVYLTYLNHYKGRSSGILRSLDGGSTWKNITYELAPINAWMVSVNPHDGTAYIGTDNGVFRMARPTITKQLLNSLQSENKTQPANIVRNPGFEEYDGKNFKDWELSWSLRDGRGKVNSVFTADTSAHSGGNALKITIDPAKEGNFWYVQENIPILAQTKYDFSAWIKKESGFRAAIAINWYNAENKKLNTENLIELLPNIDAAEFSEYVKEIISPEAAVKATLMLYVDWLGTPADHNCSAFFDDIRLSQSLKK